MPLSGTPSFFYQHLIAAFKASSMIFNKLQGAPLFVPVC